MKTLFADPAWKPFSSDIHEGVFEAQVEWFEVCVQEWRTFRNPDWLNKAQAAATSVRQNLLSTPETMRWIEDAFR